MDIVENANKSCVKMWNAENVLTVPNVTETTTMVGSKSARGPLRGNRNFHEDEAWVQQERSK